MIKITKNINGKVLIINVESYLKEQGEALINIISKIEQNKIINKFKIQIGFTIYTIIKEIEGFTIYSPDYNKNPFLDITNDLTIALWIQLEQASLLNKLKIEGEMISFQDKIVCAKGVLDLDNIYLERIANYEKGDSGWYIGAIDEDNSGNELEAYYAYQMIKLRPSIIQVLALQSGYMTVFEKNKLKAVLNEDDIDILKI